MIELVRTNWGNTEFIELVKDLDKDLAVRDGEDHLFYNQFNNIEHLKYVIVAYEKGKAVGCGAMKDYKPRALEIKRMFVIPQKEGEVSQKKFYLNWKNGQLIYPLRDVYWKPE